MIDNQIKDLSAQIELLTNLIENSPKLKDAGYVAPDSERDHANAKSFGDFLVAIRRGNNTRLKDVYGSSDIHVLIEDRLLQRGPYSSPRCKVSHQVYFVFGEYTVQ